MCFSATASFVNITGPVVATVVGKHIVYVMQPISWPALPILYLAATCVSGFFSSHTFVRLFGVLALVAAIIAYIVHVEALASVWCFFAAVLSTLIYCHLRFRNWGGYPLEHLLPGVDRLVPL